MSTMSSVVAARDVTSGRSTPQSFPSQERQRPAGQHRNTHQGATSFSTTRSPSGVAGVPPGGQGGDNYFSKRNININDRNLFARNTIGTTAYRRHSSTDSHEGDDEDEDEDEDGGDAARNHPYDTDASPGWSASGSMGGASYTPRILVDDGGRPGSSDVDARYSFENRYRRQQNANNNQRHSCGIGGGSGGNASASSSESLSKLQRRRGASSNSDGRDRAGRHHGHPHHHPDALEKSMAGSVSVSTVETQWSSSVGGSPSLRECSTIDSMSPPGPGSGPMVLPCVPDLRGGSPRMGRHLQPAPPAAITRNAYEDDEEEDGCVGEDCFRLLPRTLSSSLSGSGDWTLSTRSALVDYCDGYEYRLGLSQSVDEDGDDDDAVPPHVAIVRSVRSAVADWTYHAAKGHLRRTTRARIERSVLPVLRGASFYYNEDEADREIHSDVVDESFSASPPGDGDDSAPAPTPKKLVPKSPTRSRSGGALEMRCRPKLRSQLSDVGVALFAPLDGIFDDAEFVDGDSEEDLAFCGGRDDVPPLSLLGSHDGVERDESRGDEREEPECLFPLSLVGEPPSVLRSSPRVLDSETMQHLVDHALPMVVKMRRWVRAYSLSRDGDSFGMMLRLVRAHKYSLLAVRTTNGDVFGGFADCSWGGERAEGALRGRFYGLGQAFLFRVSSADPEADYLGGRDRVSVYRWTGENTYCQLCDEEGRRVAMGGGGEEGCFGLCLEDDFTRGSTGRCATFANEPLTDEREFQILDLEIYGFWS